MPFRGPEPVTPASPKQLKKDAELFAGDLEINTHQQLKEFNDAVDNANAALTPIEIWRSEQGNKKRASTHWMEPYTPKEDVNPFNQWQELKEWRKKMGDHGLRLGPQDYPGGNKFEKTPPINPFGPSGKGHPSDIPPYMGPFPFPKPLPPRQ